MTSSMRRFFQCIGERRDSRREIGGVSIFQYVCVCLFVEADYICTVSVVSTGRKTATNKQVFVLNFKKAFIQYFGR